MRFLRLGARAFLLTLVSATLVSIGAVAHAQVVVPNPGTPQGPPGNPGVPVVPGGWGGGGGGPGSHPSPIPISRVPQITFGSPYHGGVIDENSPYFDLATGDLTVTGGVSGLPPWSADWDVLVHDQRAGLSADGAGEAVFSVVLADYDDTQPPNVPYRNWFGDQRRPLRPVLVQLVNPGGVIVRRARALLYLDVMNDKLDPKRPTTSMVEGMAVQLAPAGLDELEAAHLATLPYPSAQDLRDDLTAAAIAAPVQTEPLGDTVCFRLDGGSPLTQTIAYQNALTEAYGWQAAYQSTGTADEACALFAAVPFAWAACVAAVNVGRSTICVKDQVLTAVDFEVCMESIELELTDLEVADVADVDLSFANGADIDALPTLTGVEATAFGTFRDMFIRYKHHNCTGSCRTDFDAADYSIAGVAEWAGCPALQLTAEQAVPAQPLPFFVAPDTNPEELEVTRGTPADFTLVGVDVDGRSGLCADPDLVTLVEDVLAAYDDEVGSAVGDGWDRGRPYTDQAAALGALLTEFELGGITHTLHEVLANFRTVATDSDDGLWLTSTTNARPRHTVARGLEAPSYYYYEEQPLQALPVAEDPNGLPFDLSFSITTGHINQVLRALTAETLRQGVPLEPTWAELGFTGVANPNDPAILNGLTLGRLDPLFRALRRTQVTISVRSTLDPFTVMALDRFGTEPPGAMPVSYNAGQLIVTIVSGGELWAAFAVDLLERDLALGESPGLGDVYLEPALNQTEWTWTPLVLLFRSCDRAPYGTNLYASSCERRVTDRLAGLLNPHLERLLLSLLEELPTPQSFDAGGLVPEGTATREATPTPTYWWRAGQVITFFDDLH